MNNQGQALTRWSRDYEKCLGCGTTTIQHWGKGYCNRCYPKYIVRKTGEFDRSNEEFYAEYKRKVNAKISEAQKIKMNSPRIVNQLNEHLLKELYCKDRLSLGDIAKRFNCSRVYILRLCNKYGVTVRTKSQARKVAYSIGKKLRYHNIDTNFFKQWTPEMAYVLGFIYADGCIDRRLTYFSISQREVEILGKIRTLLKAEQNILHRKSQDLYDLVIGSKEMVADLLKLGVVPQKSLMIKFPQMPKEFISHLIRGYFDGDGSICLNKNKYGGTWRVSFVTGSCEFINSIKENLEREALVSDQKVYSHQTASAYSLYYHSKDDFKKLYHFFYDGYALTKMLYLSRKYLLFVEAMKNKGQLED